MAGEGEWPKADGDILFASDTNGLNTKGDGHFSVLLLSPVSVGQGSFTITANSSQALCFSLDNGGGAANGDNITFNGTFSAGSYVCKALYWKSNDAGIIDVGVGGTEILSFDCYNSTNAYNQIATSSAFGINPSGGGIKNITVTVDGKNASSSNYRSRITALTFYRTY